MYELRSSADEPYIVILGSLAGKTVRQGFVFNVFRILLEAHLVLRLDLDFHDVCQASIWKCKPLRVSGKIRICSVFEGPVQNHINSLFCPDNMFSQIGCPYLRLKP
jgi:hypothetical protein